MFGRIWNTESGSDDLCLALVFSAPGDNMFIGPELLVACCHFSGCSGSHAHEHHSIKINVSRNVATRDPESIEPNGIPSGLQFPDVNRSRRRWNREFAIWKKLVMHWTE